MLLVEMKNCEEMLPIFDVKIINDVQIDGQFDKFLWNLCLKENFEKLNFFEVLFIIIFQEREKGTNFNPVMPIENFSKKFFSLNCPQKRVRKNFEI